MPDKHDPEAVFQQESAEGEASTPPSPGDDVLEMISEMESRLGRLKSAKAAEQQRLEDLIQRERDLAEREERTAGLQGEIERRQAELDQLQGEFDGARAELQRAQTELQEQRQQMETRAGELSEREAEVERASNEAQSLKSEVEAQKGDFQTQLEDLQERARVFEETAAFEQQERQEAESQLEQLRAEQERLGQTAAEMQAETARLSAELEEAGRGKSELAEQIADLERQAQQMESKVAAADEELLAAQTRLEGAEGELTAANAACEGLQQHLAEHQQEFEHEKSELRGQFEQLQSEKDSLQADLEKSRAEIVEERKRTGDAQEHLEKQTAQLNATKEKMREFSTAIEEQADATEQVVALSGRVQEQQQLIDQLQAKLKEAAGSSADSANEELLSQQLQDRDEEIEALRERLAQQRFEETEAADEQLHSLQAQVRELEAELAQAGALDSNDLPEELARQAERLGTMRQWVEARRKRLQRQKLLLSDRSEKLINVQEILQKRHAQCEQVLAERDSVVGAKRELASMEKKLIARWAAGKGSIVAFLAMLTLVALAGISYGAAIKFAPATFAASSVLKPEHHAGERVGPRERKVWAEAVQSMALSDQVLKAAADRMGQRGFTEFDQPEELKTHLSKNLQAEPQSDGLLRVEMQAAGKYPVERLLDTYVVALMQVANANRDHRPDGLITRLSSAPLADASPVSDERLLYTSYIFGGLALLSGFLFVGAWRSLARTKPIIDAAA